MPLDGRNSDATPARCFNVPSSAEKKMTLSIISGGQQSCPTIEVDFEKTDCVTVYRCATERSPCHAVFGSSFHVFRELEVTLKENLAFR